MTKKEINTSQVSIIWSILRNLYSSTYGFYGSPDKFVAEIMYRSLEIVVCEDIGLVRITQSESPLYDDDVELTFQGLWLHFYLERRNWSPTSPGIFSLEKRDYLISYIIERGWEINNA
jgi:hypothetical protein